MAHTPSTITIQVDTAGMETQLRHSLQNLTHDDAYTIAFETALEGALDAHAGRSGLTDVEWLAYYGLRAQSIADGDTDFTIGGTVLAVKAASRAAAKAAA